MNTTTVRRIVRTALTTTLAVAAFALVAAPQAAQAQGFAVGVQFGGQPAYGYVAPRQTYGYDRDDRFRAEQFQDQQLQDRQFRDQQFRDRQFRDHEAWERQQAHFNHEHREAYNRGYNNGWR